MKNLVLPLLFDSVPSCFLGIALRYGKRRQRLHLCSNCSHHTCRLREPGVSQNLGFNNESVTGVAESVAGPLAVRAIRTTELQKCQRPIEAAVSMKGARDVERRERTRE